MASQELDTRGSDSNAAVDGQQQLLSSLTWPEQSPDRPAIPERLIGVLAECLEAIPAEHEGGSAAILETLLRATSIDDLNKPWNGTSGRELAGKRISIRSVIRRPSQFEDGPQLFLVCSAVDVKTGEELTMTSSALAVIVQVGMAHKLGMLPILCEVVVADKPTERGYYPYHLNVLAAGRPAAPASDKPDF